MTTMEMFSPQMKRVCLLKSVTAVSFLGTFSKIPMKLFWWKYPSRDCKRSPVSRSCLIAALVFPLLRFHPVRNYLEQVTLLVNVRTIFAKKNKLIFDMLFKKLKCNKPDEMDVFWSWISCRSFKEKCAVKMHEAI